MDLSVVPYNKQSNMKTDNESEDGDIVEPHKTHHHTNNNNKKLLVVADAAAVKYRECMRNHAASIGGHANDGCGEFMPADAPPLTCAACGCHRNFHRRDPHASSGGAGGGHYPVILYNPPPAPGPATPRWERHASYERRSSETPERDEAATAVTTGSGGGGGASGKRFRTKFTVEQKERMLAFAESIGWRIQRQDDMAINQFCADIGVRRNVLKVWMHNNKNAHRRRDGVDVAVQHQHQHQPPMVAHSAGAVPNPQAIGV